MLTASSPKIMLQSPSAPLSPLYAAATDNRLLNEYFMYVLADFHTCQSLGALEFTSSEPHFVKETDERVYHAITATPTAPDLPATKAFSISGVCEEQYTSTLKSLQETRDEAFKDYMTRKTQAWFRRWSAMSPLPPPASGAAHGAGRAVQRGDRR